MSESTLSACRYRLRSSLRHGWTNYVSLALLVALLGGISLATVAGARSTETSFTTLIDSHDTSQLYGPLQVYNPQAGFTSGYSASAVNKVRSIPHVRNVESIVGINAFPLGPHGRTVPGDNGFAPNGSVDGLDFRQDRLIIEHGRLPNIHRANEFVADAGTVREFGWHLGQMVTFAYYTNKASVAAGLSGPKIAGHFKVRLVGTDAIQPGNVVQDQVDNNDLAIVLFTPALTKHYLVCCANDTLIGIQLNGGHRYEQQVQKTFDRLFPKIGSAPQTSSIIENRVASTLAPEALALAVFGLLTALAAVAIASQLIARIVRAANDDARILRAMGANQKSTFIDGLAGAELSLLCGILLAIAVAIALSPLAPIGPVRPYLDSHVRVDWSVIGVGAAFFTLALSVVASAIAYQNQPGRPRTGKRTMRRGNWAPTRIAGASGLPIAAVTGVGFALETSGGRRSVPMRSAIVGASIALIIVGATTTFSSSLHSLVSTPRLYGWNWDAAINGGGGVGDLPKSLIAPLAKDPDLTATSNAYFAALRIDGKVVPVMGENPGATIQPPVLSGHGLEASNQIVLGTSTLATLHKSIGEEVVVSSGRHERTRLKIVGTATLPAYGQSGGSHLEMGTGAVLKYTLIPLFERDIFDLPPGPNAILVRYKNGVTDSEGVKSLLHAVKVAGGGTAPSNLIQTIERPVQIVDYRSLGDTPIELGAVLSFGALVALGLTLLSSVRRRRRDIALLKALGFKRRQIVVAIGVQSTIAVGLGALIGLPVGILAGRVLWDLFANALHAVPHVVVPTSLIITVGISALVLANFIAALPARLASRTPPAILLRAE